MRPIRVLAVLLLSVGWLAAQNPLSGTWKLNPSKSKFPPPAPQSETAYIQADDDNFQMKDEITDAKGTTLHVTWDAKFDGKEYPVLGDPSSDSISLKRVDANTFKAILKKGGKVVSDSTIVVSGDGKTTTVNFVDTSQAAPANGSAVYDKQ